jgi:hypothetical protein
MASCVSAEQSLGCAIWEPMKLLPLAPLHATWPSFLEKPIWLIIMRATRDTCRQQTQREKVSKGAGRKSKAKSSKGASRAGQEEGDVQALANASCQQTQWPPCKLAERRRAALDC